MKSSQRLKSAILACALVLTACGGGGGSAGTSPFVTPPSTDPVAADLNVTSSAPQLANTDSSKVTITVTAVDTGKSAVAGITVKVTVAAGSDAVVTQATTVTNDKGQVTADVTAGSNKANRNIVINATSGSIVKSTNLQVVGAKVTSTLSAPVIAPNTDGTVRYRVVDQASNPMVDQVVQISAPGFSPASATGRTDINGEFLFSFNSPAATSSYNISATISGATNDVTVNVQPASSVPIVPPELSINSASVSASPSVLPINATGTQNRSEIRALFLGPNNAPIKNVRARFDLNGDANSIGGSFTNGSAILYSDVNGIVSTAYIAGSRPSPTNGVTVRVCYGKTDTDVAGGACPFAAFVSLTVVNDPLGVTIGTDGLIEINTAKLTYIRKYVVQVVDSAGNAKADVNISASIDLPHYYKGEYFVGDRWFQVKRASCLNEDANRNGVLEGATEDIDKDNRLDPGKSDVSLRLLNTKTGTDGLAILQIEYPQNYGSWVAAKITVNGSGISGTEGRASFLEDPVPVPTSVVQNKESTPPFRQSPYDLYGATTLYGGVDGCALTPAQESDLRAIDNTKRRRYPFPAVIPYPDPAMGGADLAIDER